MAILMLPCWFDHSLLAVVFLVGQRRQLVLEETYVDQIALADDHVDGLR